MRPKSDWLEVDLGFVFWGFLCFLGGASFIAAIYDFIVRMNAALGTEVRNTVSGYREITGAASDNSRM